MNTPNLKLVTIFRRFLYYLQYLLVLTEHDRLIEFMHNMSKKGFCHVLEYVLTHEGSYYSEIQRYAQANGLVSNSASITTMLNWMVSFQLLQRHVVSNVRPIRIRYTATKKGQDAYRIISSIDF